jgi:hypothetical protein
MELEHPQLFLEVQSGTITLEKDLAVSYKINHVKIYHITQQFHL